MNAEIGPPKQGRDHQGSITFKLGFDPNLITDANLFGNAREHSLMLTRWLERLFFMGNALDREALCIVAGKMAKAFLKCSPMRLLGLAFGSECSNRGS